MTDMIFAFTSGSYSFVEIARAAVIIAALVAVVLIAMKGMGVALPQWAIHIIVVVVIAFVAVVAIGFLESM